MGKKHTASLALTQRVILNSISAEKKTAVSIEVNNMLNMLYIVLSKISLRMLAYAAKKGICMVIT